MKTKREVTKTYVELFYPGTLFAENERHLVKKRDANGIAKKYPGAFSFQFYDLTSKPVNVDGVERIVAGHRKKVSPKYYPGGTILTAEDVKSMAGDHKILLSNMVGNGWERIVRCRTGNFQPFEKGDVVL